MHYRLNISVISSFVPVFQQPQLTVVTLLFQFPPLAGSLGLKLSAYLPTAVRAPLIRVGTQELKHWNSLRWSQIVSKGALATFRKLCCCAHFPAEMDRGHVGAEEMCLRNAFAVLVVGSSYICTFDTFYKTNRYLCFSLQPLKETRMNKVRLVFSRTQAASTTSTPSFSWTAKQSRAGWVGWSTGGWTLQRGPVNLVTRRFWMSCLAACIPKFPESIFYDACKVWLGTWRNTLPRRAFHLLCLRPQLSAAVPLLQVVVVSHRPQLIETAVVLIAPSRHFLTITATSQMLHSTKTVRSFTLLPSSFWYERCLDHLRSI